MFERETEVRFLAVRPIRGGGGKGRTNKEKEPFFLFFFKALVVGPLKKEHFYAFLSLYLKCILDIWNILPQFFAFLELYEPFCT